MSSSDTSSRILNAAEALFAENGFTETSLRSITTAARVNLAAVNYHFGSKKGLVQAVFARYLDAYCAQLEACMAEVEPGQTMQIYLALLQEAAVRTHAIEDGPSEDNMRSLIRMGGYAYSQSQGHLRKYIQSEYAAVFSKYIELLRSAMPNLSPTEIYWRLHFAFGCLVFTLTTSGTLSAIYEAEYGRASNTEDVMASLASFVAAGLQH